MNAAAASLTDQKVVHAKSLSDNNYDLNRQPQHHMNINAAPGSFIDLESSNQTLRAKNNFQYQHNQFSQENDEDGGGANEFGMVEPISNTD